MMPLADAWPLLSWLAFNIMYPSTPVYLRPSKTYLKFWEP